MPSQVSPCKRQADLGDQAIRSNILRSPSRNAEKIPNAHALEFSLSFWQFGYKSVSSKLLTPWSGPKIFTMT